MLDPDLVNWSVDGFGTHFTCKNREGLSLIGKIFLWRRSMVNILRYVRQLKLFLMFSFFCLDFALFYQVLAKFLMKKTLRLLAMCSMCMHYNYLVVICDFQPMTAALSGCHLMFETKDVAILLKYLIDTRIKIL